MHFLYIKEGKNILGVCLDFNIVEEGKNLSEVKKHLETAAALHLQTVREKKLSDDLLNRRAPEKYWRLFELTLGRNPQRTIVSAIASPYFKNSAQFAALV